MRGQEGSGQRWSNDGCLDGDDHKLNTSQQIQTFPFFYVLRVLVQQKKRMNLVF